ncbi:hypothetical protein PILCRDRAFT_810017 [Piloderma croceum F 1598]|uniref:Uncharacterized protein n=1 Tax=Piloderma croceum (strain F 1598) TaxID=765440 RepID=A0A0C3CQU9_PILCF|nr:hypothetical protein PILCRDRAFT_810017 [Piloderma croceum F 1598]
MFVRNIEYHPSRSRGMLLHDNGWLRDSSTWSAQFDFSDILIYWTPTTPAMRARR